MFLNFKLDQKQACIVTSYIDVIDYWLSSFFYPMWLTTDWLSQSVLTKIVTYLLKNWQKKNFKYILER